MHVPLKNATAMQSIHDENLIHAHTPRLTDVVCAQLVLDEEDKKDRFKAAQEPKKYVASGGLTGFRVADDLFKMHLDYADNAPDPEAWREPPKPKKGS